MRDKIKVLFLASDPFHDRAPLRLDEEVRTIGNALLKGRARDGVELIPYFATRTRDLQEALLRHDPQIVHFAGHGGGSGVIYLGDAHGRPGAVGKEALAELFGILSEWIKVVILNGCGTLPIVEALSDVVDYSIGMNAPLTDASAIVFAEAFYGAVGMGRTVKTSFQLAVSQLKLEGNAEASKPVLRIRSGVDPTVPLVTPAALPSPGPDAEGGAAVESSDAGMISDIKSFQADDVLFENRPGTGKSVHRFDNVSGRGFIFRNN
ncbi:MAG TPA: hypothetical protein VF710_15790 [Longimicrobium sp.]|jgi:hypothetical protein